MILEWGVGSQPIGRRGGEVETVRQHFERRYGERLEPTPNSQRMAMGEGW